VNIPPERSGRRPVPTRHRRFRQWCEREVLRGILVDLAGAVLGRGNKAYDSEAPDQALKEQRTEMIAPHRSNRTLQTQYGRSLRRYARRWLVERYFAWLQPKRRLVVCWEYRASNLLGLVELAAIALLRKRNRDRFES
jgi:transposase